MRPEGGGIAFLATPLEERKHGKKKDPDKLAGCNARQGNAMRRRDARGWIVKAPLELSVGSKQYRYLPL